MYRILIILLTIICFWDLSAQNQSKVALIIGNASYMKSPLRNPLNDADDVTAKLKSLEFDVISAKDCKTKRDMRRALDKFCTKASHAEAGVFYYSGHGMQLSNDGGNYLIPINAEMASEADVPEECISLNYVLNKMEECGINMKIAIIDACRDNPFRTWHRGGAKGLSTPGAVPSGTFIAFATSANDVAADGEDRNSPFTKAFLTALDSENLEIGNVFTEVKRIVKQKTNGDQRPWTSSDLSDQFYFSNKTDQKIKSPITSHFVCPICSGKGISLEGKVCIDCEGTGMLNEEKMSYIISKLKNESSKIEEHKDTLSQNIKSNTGTTINTLNGHNFVDLDLPSGLLWATCNIGAKNPEDIGEYYSWGATSWQIDYYWENTPYQTKVINEDFSKMKFTKYLGSKSSSYKARFAKDSDVLKTVLDPGDDAAHVKWGGNWRIPTDIELKELMTECIWTWTTQNGIEGYQVTSRKNNNSIFLPAGGYRNYENLYRRYEEKNGCYWSSSLNSNKPYEAFCLNFGSGGMDITCWGRNEGLTIRPVSSSFK